MSRPGGDPFTASNATRVAQTALSRPYEGRVDPVGPRSCYEEVWRSAVQHVVNSGSHSFLKPDARGLLDYSSESG